MIEAPIGEVDAWSLETSLRLAWKRVGPAGGEPLERFLDLAASADRRGARPSPVFYRNELPAGGTYRADLPSEARSENTFLVISYQGPIDADPDRGPRLIVDGVVLGFSIPATGLNRRVHLAYQGLQGSSLAWGHLDGGTPIQNGVVRGVTQRELRTLIDRGLSFGNVGERTGALPNLYLRLNRARRTWDLFGPRGSSVLLQGIPYEPSVSDVPSITVLAMPGDRPAVITHMVMVTPYKGPSQQSRSPQRQGTSTP